MRRVLIYGCTGAGKTTLATEIAGKFDLPLVDVDQHTFGPDWTPKPDAEQRELFARLSAEEQWVFDTAYGKWFDIVYPRCDTVIALDYPRWLSLARLIRRTARRVISREKVCGENRESLRLALSRESILVWHFRSFRRKQRRMDWIEAHAEGRTVHRFRHPRELKAWMASQEKDAT